MDRADSAVSGALQRLTSPPVLLAVLALIVAGVIALLVARALRTRTARAAGSPPPPVHWLDALETALNGISLLPGRTTLSVWGLLKGLVVVTAFVIVASLVARAIERHVMKLDQLAVSTRVGVSKFTYFLLLGLGVLLGVNAAGVDVTTVNVLTGAIGLGLGFGLQSV